MAVELKLEELTAFKHFRDYFDRNSDGKISISELDEAMKILFLRAPSQGRMNEEEIKALFAEADADGNQTLDLSEFMKAYGIVLKKRLQNKDDKRALEEAFWIFDINFDDYMTADELAQLMMVLGEKMTPDEIVQMIKEADANNDNKISLDEFTKVMENKYRK